MTEEEDRLRVFIGSLPTSAGEEDVKSFLVENGWSGEVRLNVLVDKKTGQKKGIFCFLGLFLFGLGLTFLFFFFIFFLFFFYLFFLFIFFFYFYFYFFYFLFFFFILEVVVLFRFQGKRMQRERFPYLMG